MNTPAYIQITLKFQVLSELVLTHCMHLLTYYIRQDNVLS